MKEISSRKIARGRGLRINAPLIGVIILAIWVIPILARFGVAFCAFMLLVIVTLGVAPLLPLEWTREDEEDSFRSLYEVPNSENHHH